MKFASSAAIRAHLRQMKNLSHLFLGLSLIFSSVASANHSGLFAGTHKHRIVLNAAGFRQFSNGKTPKNCYQYLNPVSSNTAYEGATGSGVYIIDPDGTGTQLPIY
jgi:hypothetical protein